MPPAEKRQFLGQLDNLDDPKEWEDKAKELGVKDPYLLQLIRANANEKLDVQQQSVRQASVVREPA